MSATRPAWVEGARSLPIAFAQVREDPLLDLEIVRRGGAARVLMIASGGCTACALAASGLVTTIHLVDPNPAQIALTRLKLNLLQDAVPEERLRLLGHLPMPREQRARALERRLNSLAVDPLALGPTEIVGELGPDHAGRYERLFAALRARLSDEQAALTALCALASPEEQARRVAPATSLGRALDAAFAETMDLSNLVALFGAQATRNPLKRFATHFTEQTRAVLGRRAAVGNPFLSQMLIGRFSAGYEYLWLQAERAVAMPHLEWTNAFMSDALSAQGDDWDVVHLSNILDWLSAEAARATLELAWAALRPGGWVVIRQLNSSLDVMSCGPRFRWDVPWAEDLLGRDRSFFYRALHVGRKA
jgi:uncharacterized protein DUF3419